MHQHLKSVHKRNGLKCTMSHILQGLILTWPQFIVQNMDNAIHRINLYPVDNAISFPNTYPMDGASYPSFEQPEPLNYYCLSYLWT